MSTTAVFERLDLDNRAAFIGYLPVGFPTVDASIDAARAMVDAGVDIVELGFPYSDPSMDGPLIQHAGQVALERGLKRSDVFRAVEAVSATGAPVLVMTYYNLVFTYGEDNFARDLANAGGAGMIIPDLIPDEGQAWIAAADAHNLDKVFLVAPSSTDERLALTASASRGFVYAASRMGVTGVQDSVGSDAEELVTRTRAQGADRVGVGIGVSTNEHAKTVGRYADGVIVGSALVKPLVEADSVTGGIDHLSEVAALIAAGVRDARR